MAQRTGIPEAYRVNMKLFSAAVVLAALAVFTACNGNLVVGTGSTGGGADGAGSFDSADSSSSTGGSTSLFCGAPAGLSGLFDCGDTGSSGAGGATSCESTFCVPLGEGKWVASCQGDTCQCGFQGGGGGEGPVMPMCNCTLPGGADACQSGTNCCFTAQ